MGKTDHVESIKEVRTGGDGIGMNDKDYLTDLALHAINYTVGLASAMMFVGSLPDGNWSGICVGFVGMSVTAWMESKEPEDRANKKLRKFKTYAKTKKVKKRIIKVMEKEPGRNYR